jgi:nucleoside-diphosphate-sugar epimerase
VDAEHRREDVVRVLLTGSEGFIGGHLRKELETHGHPVAGIDLARGQTHDLLYEPTIRHYLDVVKPDVCIHLAAKVGRLFGEDDIRKTIEDNAWMTANVAKACGERGVRLMYASTSEVYGDRGEHVCLEDEPFVGVPHNIYGLSKRWGEEACRLYAPENLTIMRFSMPYGHGLPAGRGALLSSTSSIPLFILSLSLFIVGVSVLGVGLGILLVRRVSSSKANTRGRYNVGRDDNARSMLEVAEMACDLAGAPYDLIQLVDPPERQTVVKRLATSKIRMLGWTPRVSLEEGMERVYEWVREQYPVVSVA